MPDDGERLFGVAELDRRHVYQITVLLARVVVQPAHDLDETFACHDDSRLVPHDGAATDRVAEARPEGRDGGILRAAAVRDVLGRDGRGCRRAGTARVHDACRTRSVERGAHTPDRVWLTELPNGSESSSIVGGGM